MGRTIKQNFKLLLVLLISVLIFSSGCNVAAVNNEAVLIEIEEVKEPESHGNNSLNTDTSNNPIENLESHISIDSDPDYTTDIDPEHIDSNNMPTLKLEIYEGPYYVEGDTLCFYRINATAGGEPEPEIIFSRDDANGFWGNNISQIKLGKDESYTLVVKAKNSNGEVYDYINLSWVKKPDYEINYKDIDFNNSESFKIDVNLGSQVVRIYYNDYLIREMVCSGGAEETPTPPGEFTTSQKIEYAWVDRFEMGAFYWIRFYGSYLFHSVPFDKNKNIIEEEFEKLGIPASHGCIRLALEDAKWLYDKLPLGVKVYIH
jgi:lipoprotein-anchoring transpeptidase ErfK/SrfK